MTVFEVGKKREGDKRKRKKNPDPSDIDGFLGPWGKFVDEKTVMKPSEVSIDISITLNKFSEDLEIE